MQFDLTELPKAERRSLAKQGEAARLFADIMQLNGARVRSGDVLDAMARLGLRFVSVDDGDPSANAQARAAAITEVQDCRCDGVWIRLTDAEEPDAGWWHQYDYNERLTRKCQDRRDKPKALTPPTAKSRNAV